MKNTRGELLLVCFLFLPPIIPTVITTKVCTENYVKCVSPESEIQVTLSKPEIFGFFIWQYLLFLLLWSLFNLMSWIADW